jgi:cAMP phosphodiesterase
MKNIDCEVYVSQLITFFDKNPNDLMLLIGDLQKEDFYKKLKEQCYKNAEESDDHVITKQQMIDIIIELKIPQLSKELNVENVIEGVVQKTKWGEIILN